MDATEQGYFQTAIMRQSPTDVVYRAERFDVVIGSSRKGQTYLFWKGDQLFELPVSYWVGLDEWVNSPGYHDGTAFFSKGVTPRCLECHATSFKSLTPPLNRYDKTSLVLGMTCEKCHGPGGEHVARVDLPSRGTLDLLSAGSFDDRYARRRRILSFSAGVHGTGRHHYRCS